MFERIVTLISLCVSAISVIANIIIIKYQIITAQNFEKEKMKLEIYSDFIMYCCKKTTQELSESERNEFYRLNAKLSLIVDEPLREMTQQLFDMLYSEPKSERTIKLLHKEQENMSKQLRTFNRRYRRFLR